MHTSSPELSERFLRNYDKHKQPSKNCSFFPIFLGASLAVIIDSIQLLLDETVVGNLFDDVAFGAINLLEPYLLPEEFFTYLICVGGTALIVRALGANRRDEKQKIFNHCVTCCLILGTIFCIAYSLFDEQLVRLVAQDSPAYPFSLAAFFWNRFYILILPLYVFLFTYVLYMNGALIDTISMIVMVAVNTVLSFFLAKYRHCRCHLRDIHCQLRWYSDTGHLHHCNLIPQN